VEKIVVVTNETGNDNTLIKLLKAHFPECEICTVSLYGDGLKTCSNDSSQGRSKADKRGGSHGKHFDRR
jgi:hypothetical protein